MGTPGDRRTTTAKDAAADIVERLIPFGAVTARGMFGGFGLSLDGVMFGLVNSAGTVHFRVDDASRARIEAAGGVPFARMPYVSVPEAVLADRDALMAGAAEALTIAQSAKR